MKTEGLLKALHLPLSAPSATELEQLKTWCANNVSRDLLFAGSTEQQYAKYAELATIQRTFTELAQGDVTAPNPKLGELSAIQYAAMCGFDVYLEKIECTPTQVNQVTSKGGNTPLHLAASGGHLLAVEQLIRKGARLDVLDNQDNTPAMRCLMLSGASSREKRQQLFERLKDTRDLFVHHNRSGNTIFHLAAQFGFQQLLRELIAVRPEGLLEQNSDHLYPIQLAIRQVGNSKETVELFLSYPEAMRALSTDTQEVALHDAARYINEDATLAEGFVAACILADIPLNLKNSRGQTPLALAAKAMNKNMIMALLTHGIHLVREDIVHAYQDNHNIAFCEWMVEQRPDLHHVIDEIRAHEPKLS